MRIITFTIEERSLSGGLRENGIFWFHPTYGGAKEAFYNKDGNFAARLEAAANKLPKDKKATFKEAANKRFAQLTNRSRKTPMIGWALLILAALVLIWVVVANNNKTQVTIPGTKTEETAAVCSGSWVMKDETSDPAINPDGNWFVKGYKDVYKAKSDADASKLAFNWLERVKKAPNLLVGAASSFGIAVDKTALVNENNCATDKAVQLTAELSLTLAKSRITLDNAPANGYNSGVQNGAVVWETNPGVNGDRRAIHIVLPNGKEIWILGVCGNVVTPGKPPVTQLEAKDPSKDPSVRGNSPDGSGKNQDQSSGKFTTPAEVTQPPAAPRVNPTPPTVTLVPVGSTPDQTPAPAIEPSAPTPDAPATGTVTAPGM